MVETRLFLAILHMAIVDAGRLIENPVPENIVWRVDARNLLRWFQSSVIRDCSCAWICLIVDSNHEFFLKTHRKMLTDLEKAINGEIKGQKREQFGGFRGGNKKDRDLEIYKRVANKESTKDLGLEFGLTQQRISQIHRNQRLLN